MKTQLTILLFLLLVISCSNDEKICHLTGHLENAPDTTTLFLADREKGILLDSIQIINGNLDYKFKLSHPEKILLHNKRNQYDFRDRKSIWLEPSEIKINGNFEFLKSLKIVGSNTQTEFENYNLLANKSTKQINELKEQIHFKTDEEKKKDTIKIELLQANLSDSIVGFMIKYPDSYVTLFSLHDECYLASRHLSKKQISKVYNNLSENLKGLNQGIEIKQYMELPEPPKVGDLAPEIVQLTPNGDTIKLSDYRGKYVLLDFWSSTCAPCRGDFKWLKKFYDKYNPNGLEIFGISGDIKKQDWISAIEHDSVPWINISDLKGWKNEAFLTYDIKAIPDKFLIDPDGKIVKNGIWLRSEYSTNFVLAEIFENKKNGL